MRHELLPSNCSLCLSQNIITTKCSVIENQYGRNKHSSFHDTEAEGVMYNMQNIGKALV